MTQMYNNNRYSDKVIDVTVTAIVENRDIFEIHDYTGVVATTKFDTHINELVIGNVNKLHIREDFQNGNSYFLKVI